MKILVTGGNGFIGNYVIQELLKHASNEVIVTSKNQEKAKSQSWYSQVTFLPYDFNDRKMDEINLFDYFLKPDKLIHLAWEGLPNYNEPFHFNINLPQNSIFLSKLVNEGLKDILVTGTCFEYGLQSGCLSEDLETHPINYYALAKDSLRKYLELLKEQVDFSFKWVRLFYMYGLGQNPSSIISQLNKAIDSGSTTFNMSGGDQIRDYLPVEVIASNLVAISMQDSITGIINNCSGKPITVKKFIENYLNTINKKIELNLGYYPYSKNEPMEFWGDTNKLNKIINYGS